jgi:regulator of ribonuclease activity B
MVDLFRFPLSSFCQLPAHDEPSAKLKARDRYHIYAGEAANSGFPKPGFETTNVRFSALAVLRRVEPYSQQTAWLQAEQAFCTMEIEMTLFDDNAEVLRRMADAGDDLEKARPMDFSHIFATQAGAIAFARRADVEGFEAVVRPYDKPGFTFDVTVTTKVGVIPTCELVTSIEQRLGVIAAQYDGRSDGWGCFEG